MGTMVSLLIAAAKAVASWLGFKHDDLLVEHGEIVQSETDLKNDVQTVERERQADVDAPLTGDDVIKRLEDGSA